MTDILKNKNSFDTQKMITAALQEDILGPQRMNRRVQVTKQLLKEAVIDILNEGAAKKLSVRLICHRAGVNRSTFYSHYDDQDALLTEMTLETIQAAKAFASAWFGKETYHENLVRMLQYYKENASFFLSLLRTDFSQLFIECIENSIWEQYVQKKLARGLTPTEEDRLGIAFTSAGSINVVQSWLKKKDPRESTESIAKILLNLYRNIRFQVR